MSTYKLLRSKDLYECPACSRCFTQQRIKIHEAICQKSALTTIKMFDPSHQRLIGMDMGQITKKFTGSNTNKIKKKSPSPLSTNWRQKHEEFLQTVRKKKSLELEKNKCGKADDLPMSPVLNCDDFIQCPNCMRQFNSASADRHIATCERMMNERSISKNCLTNADTKLSEVNVAEK